MIGVIPSPMLSATVIIVQDPLESFDILLKHFLLKRFTTFTGDINMEFLVIVKSFGLCWILGKH